MLDSIRGRTHIPVPPVVQGTRVPYRHETYARTWAPTAAEVAAAHQAALEARLAFPKPQESRQRLRIDGVDPIPANALKLAQKGAQRGWSVIATRSTGTLMGGDGLPAEDITWAQVPDEDGTWHRRKTGSTPIGPQVSFLVRCFRSTSRADLLVSQEAAEVAVVAGWWIGGRPTAKGSWVGSSFERGTVAWPMRGANWNEIWTAIDDA